MKKRSILVLCAVALSISLVGCGGKDKDSSTEGLSEITPSLTEAPVQGYVPPKPNDPKAEEDSTTQTEDGVILDGIETYFDLSDENRKQYRDKGIYMFYMPVQFTNLEYHLYEDLTAYTSYYNDKYENEFGTVEYFAITTTTDSLDTVKANVEAKNPGLKVIDNWTEYQGTNFKFLHYSYEEYEAPKMDNSLEFDLNVVHTFVHQREDGNIGVIVGKFLSKVEWKCMLDSMLESDVKKVEKTEKPTETQTEQTSESTTEQVSENTSEQTTEDTSSEVEASTETTETQTTE